MLPVNMQIFSLFIFVTTIFTFILTSTAISTITPNQNISDGQTITSDDETFTMGFFSPSNSSSSRYFGIWYNKISVMTVVWVANRDTPILDNSGVLLLNDKGTLVLVNRTNSIIWSSNSSITRVNDKVAQLLDTGNLVIRNTNDMDPENYLWQSFDYMGDTSLPGMKFGKDFVRGVEKYLTSWKSVDDPSIGEYTNRFDYNGYPQVFLRKGSDVKHRSGPWNGLRFSGMANLKPNDIYTFGFEFNEKEIYYKYELLNKSVVSRMILTPSGLMQRLIWVERTKEWVVYVTGQMDDCDRYGLCGQNGICNINNSPACGCWNGFEPKFSEEWERADWSNGCVRRVDLNCSVGDGFVKHSNVKLPDTRKTWFNMSMNIEECEKECRKRCNCTAYANLDVMTRTGCLIWSEDLVDIRTYSESGQDIYVRMAAAELYRNAKAKRRVRIIVIPIVVGVTVLLGICLFVYRRMMKKKKKGLSRVVRIGNANEGGDWELPLFEFNTLADATNNFSHSCKLGEGGYGAVYKGMLEDGKEIAVKRHSSESKQGLDEFMNEVQCIAKLQHRNLVKLLGCCIEKGERMLIYEYMPNLSLNYYIFDKDEGKRKVTRLVKPLQHYHWNCKGLLYLHQDSRLRIIHRDLKASNILLDKDMNPRISDFGLARSMEGSITKGNTRRVMGTYGYMAPEYTIDGIYSIKSDVFSFGVLVLEIVSGKKNRGFHHTDHDLNLLGHVVSGRKQLELIDGTIKDSYVQSQVNRAIDIGLLCVQKYPEVRPDMLMVVLMPASEIPLPKPVEPGFFTERRPLEGKSPSTNQSSYNHISITSVQPR